MIRLLVPNTEPLCRGFRRRARRFRPELKVGNRLVRANEGAAFAIGFVVLAPDAILRRPVSLAVACAMYFYAAYSCSFVARGDEPLPKRHRA